MGKNNILEKFVYVVGIVTAAGGLISAIVGDKDKEKLKERVKALEDASKK